MISMYSWFSYCHYHDTTVYILGHMCHLGKGLVALAVHKQVTVVQMAE